MHTIRLRGAWGVTSDARSRTQHTRNFGRPRTLDADERLWLVCAHVPGAGEVFVNGEIVGTLTSAGPFAVDITGRLLPRNTVAFVVASAEALGEVVLEIRRTANG